MRRYFILLLIVYITSSCQVNKKNQSNIDLLNAAKKGDIAGVEAALTNGADVNYQDEKGETALIIAVKAKDKKTIRLLTKYNANIYIKAEDGKCAEYLALRSDDDLLFLLIKVNLTDLEYLAFEGIYYNQPNKLDIAIKLGLDVNKMGFLREAVNKHNNQAVSSLLKHGADINQLSELGETPLMLAAINGYRDIVEMLLKYHPDLNISSSDDSWTAVFLSASSGYFDITKLLIESGADITIKPFEDPTILAEAARKGSIEMMQYMLDRGEDINELCFYNENALFYAIRGKQLEAVKFLVENGIYFNITNIEGYTPFTEAKEQNNPLIVEYLLSVGAK